MQVIAARVASGLQPVRRALPQLLPERLGHDLNLRLAHTVAHPFTATPTPPAPCAYAMAHAVRDASEARYQRTEMLRAIELLAEVVVDEDAEFLKLVDPFIRPVVSKRCLAFIREVSLAAGWHDPTLLIGLAFGLPPLVGLAEHPPCLPAGRHQKSSWLISGQISKATMPPSSPAHARAKTGIWTLPPGRRR